jgi:cytochrome P450
VEARRTEVCAELANALTHTLVSELFGLTQERVQDLHAASEMIDISADPSSKSAQVDYAVSLFCRAALESKVVAIARMRAREAKIPLDRKTIVDNIGMLLYGMFGPLPAAFSNIVLAMSLNEGWSGGKDSPPSNAWLHESLRLYSPTVAIDRVATYDMSIFGTSVRSGQLVRCVVAAANRDGTVFQNPFKFDARRPNAKNHLAFGRGVHSCLAQGLVERVGGSLIRHLAAHTRRILLLSKPIEWRILINATGPKQLLVRLV